VDGRGADFVFGGDEEEEEEAARGVEAAVGRAFAFAMTVLLSLLLEATRGLGGPSGTGSSS